jgi:hypothetical protein
VRGSVARSLGSQGSHHYPWGAACWKNNYKLNQLKHVNQITSNQIKSNQIKSNQIKSTQLNSTQLNSNQLNSTQLNSTQLNSTQIKSSPVKSIINEHLGSNLPLQCPTLAVAVPLWPTIAVAVALTCN